MNEIEALAEEFSSCRKMLIALGDENRCHLILEMMKMGECRGVRVGEITEKTNLSRPAVSHHLLRYNTWVTNKKQEKALLWYN